MREIISEFGKPDKNQKLAELLFFDLDKITVEIHEHKKQPNFSKDELTELEYKFYNVFNNLYVQSAKDNMLWQYCPFVVYESHYESRLEEYIKNFPDAFEIDFINVELNSIENYYQEEETFVQPYTLETIIAQHEGYTLDLFLRESLCLNEILDEETIKKIEYSQKRKLDFLQFKKENIEGVNINQNQVKVTKEIELNDYSNNKIPERITILHELGILDYLIEKQPFNTANNKLAEILSSFMGEEQTNIQPYINPIFSKGVKQNKNPLPKHTDNVHIKLINMGMNPKDFKTKKD